MTKYSFLNELDQLLQGLDEAERREILEDYEEHFAFAKRSDKSVEDVIKSVGTPQEIAQEIFGENDSNETKKDPTIHVGTGDSININGMDIGSFVDSITSSVESLVENITENVGERFEYSDETIEGATESTTEIIEVVDVTDVKNVIVDAKNQKISITKTSEPNARIKLSRGILSAKVEDDALKIEAREIKRKFVIGNFINIEMGSKLTIELPEREYELIKAKTANARIEIADFALNKLDLDSTNGRLEAHRIAAKDLKLRTFNGGIGLENITGSVEAGTTNGGIKIKNLTGKVDTHTTNGGIKLEMISGPIDAYTTNGGIKLETTTIEHSVDLSTTNSKIEVKLKQKPEHAKFELSTTHGKTFLFGHERNYEVLGSGVNVVDLSTTNGKIEVLVEN